MGMLSSHPNIVTIFDAGVTDDGRPYLVMEYMPGGTLDDRLDQDGPLAWEDTVDIGVKLAGRSRRPTRRRCCTGTSSRRTSSCPPSGSPA